MSETVEFPCPQCHTFLRVPTHLAGISGPCPHCQTSITSPSSPPTSKIETPESDQSTPPPPSEPLKISSKPVPKTPSKIQPEPPLSSYNDERNGKERKLLPSVIFLALVLSLTAAAIYLILDGMGMIGPKDKAHPPTQSPSVEDSTESDVPDPENPQVPVVTPPLPCHRHSALPCSAGAL